MYYVGPGLFFLECIVPFLRRGGFPPDCGTLSFPSQVPFFEQALNTACFFSFPFSRVGRLRREGFFLWTSSTPGASTDGRCFLPESPFLLFSPDFLDPVLFVFFLQFLIRGSLFFSFWVRLPLQRRNTVFFFQPWLPCLFAGPNPFPSRRSLSPVAVAVPLNDKPVVLSPGLSLL